jgi:CRP-like cAMP-binding protein
MERYAALINWLASRNIAFTRSETRLLMQFTKITSYPAFEQLMVQDECTTKLYFLNKGIVRLFRLYDSRDYTLGIVSTQDFFSTPLYVISGEKSPCAIESLTEIEVLEWNRDDILAIKELFPKIYNLELAIMERVFSWVQLNQIEMICLTAEERYKKLMEEQPEVLLNIPLKYAASLLGIHTDSLSRIRKKYV